MLHNTAATLRICELVILATPFDKIDAILIVDRNKCREIVANGFDSSQNNKSQFTLIYGHFEKIFDNANQKQGVYLRIFANNQ